MKFKHYPKPFDIKKPPPCPPNRDGTQRPWGWLECKESKQRTKEYQYRLNEYGKCLEIKDNQ